MPSMDTNGGVPSFSSSVLASVVSRWRRASSVSDRQGSCSMILCLACSVRASCAHFSFILSNSRISSVFLMTSPLSFSQLMVFMFPLFRTRLCIKKEHTYTDMLSKSKSFSFQSRMPIALRKSPNQHPTYDNTGKSLYTKHIVRPPAASPAC